MKKIIVKKAKELGVMNTVAAVYGVLGVMIVEIMFLLGLADVYDFGEALTMFMVYYHLIGFAVLGAAFVIDKVVGWLTKAAFRYDWTIEK